MGANPLVLQDVSPDGAGPEVAAVVAIVQEVMGEGAALGWSGVPTNDEARAWWLGLLDDIGAGRAAAVAAYREGGGSELIGLGEWRRYARAPQAINADLEKVFVRSAGRGSGAGTRIVERLVGLARRQGIETLTLDCRGNNHGAIRLYERLGFEEYGRLADFVASGPDRWDKVLMRLDLRRGDEPLNRHAGAAVGEGSSR